MTTTIAYYDVTLVTKNSTYVTNNSTNLNIRNVTSTVDMNVTYVTNTTLVNDNTTMSTNDVTLSRTTIAMTTTGADENDAIISTVTLAGSIAAIVIYFCIIGLLFGMGMRGVRSHIHCNVCFSLMTSHILLLVGSDRTAGSTECKIVSMATQFSILVGLTWLMLEGIHLFHLSMVGSDFTTNHKRRRKKRRVSVIGIEQQPATGYNHKLHPRTGRHRGRPTESVNDDVTQDQNIGEPSNTPSSGNDQIYNDQELLKLKQGESCCVSRLLSYYVIGWIGPAMFIGATVPAALQGYGRSQNCWLATDNEILWVFGAPLPAIFLFHCLATMLAILNYKERIKRENLVEQNERTKLTDAEMNTGDPHTQNVEADEAPTPPILARTDSRIAQRGKPHQMVQVENNRNAIMNGQLGNISSDDESDDTYNAYKYVRMKNGNNSTNHDDYHNNVMIHPPIYEVTQKTLSVTLPDDESNEPAQNYLSAVHWNLFLIPLVSATWACGILSINFRLVPLIYTFCVLNVLQAIYIFAYYCVVTFRLRHKWFVMTSHEYNQNARPVTVWLGNDPGDDYDVINGRRMGRKRRKKRKIPNIDLMTRTPTPFQSAPPIELLERQTQHSTKSQPRSSRPKANSVSKSVDSKLPWISKTNHRKPMLNRLHTSVPAMTSFCDVVTGDMAENEIPVTRNANRYSIRKDVHKLETDSNRTSQSKTQYEVAVSQSDSTLVIRGESQRSSYASLKNEQIFGQVMPVSSSRQTKLPALPGNPNLEEKDELSDSQSFTSDFDDILRSLDPRAGESYILPDKNTRSAKIPFVKSVSDDNVLTRSRVLKSRNSLPCSPEKQESKLDLSEIISNEPFSASTSRESPDKQTDNSYSRTSSGQGSDKALLSTTPPMRIDDGDENTLPDIKQNERLSNETTVLASIHPRKTYDLEPESGNSSSTEPCTPLPRKQSQKFSPIPMPDLTMKNSLLKNKKSR